MLKIGKGLHKKKKSKKNKHKEDELFTEEELDQYRKEQSQKEAATATAENDSENPGQNKKKVSEEFEKFKALTAGVDDILRKSQGDLDRIKKESFFQRKPTPSEIKAREENERRESKQTQGNWIDFGDRNQSKAEPEEGKGQEAKEEEPAEESESEFEFHEGSDVFDTAYVEALETGELKLAYVPEDDEVIGAGEPDPFDTTSAEEILKRVQQEEEKKKRQICLGQAVHVLTGRADRDKSLLEESGAAVTLEANTAASRPRKRPRKIQDVVLIGSFDEDIPRGPPSSVQEPPKSLLDNDINVECELPEGDALTKEVLSKQEAPKFETLLQNRAEEKEKNCENSIDLKDVVTEFDVIKEEITPEVRKAEVEDQFDEFTALAASSVANQKLEEELQKFENPNDDPFDTTTAEVVLKEQSDPFGNLDSNVPPPQIPELPNQKWKAFESQPEPEEDPFDTTFVEKIQPGKCELKLLENEILGNIIETAHKSDVHQEARILSRNNSESEQNQIRHASEQVFLPGPKTQSNRSKVSIKITGTNGSVESQRSSKDEDFESLTYRHRDLLGGSNTDLTKLGNDPLPPEIESPAEDFSKYSDPFDTSIADRVSVPGKAELKSIEKELLLDVGKTEEKDTLSDEDFDPREGEFSDRKVSFDVPSPLTEKVLLNTSHAVRPLTPYRLDAGDSEPETCDFQDPFDTSALNTLPGKEELKIIEKELNSVQISDSVSEPVYKKLGIVEGTFRNPEPGLTHSHSVEGFKTALNFSSDSRRFSEASGFALKLSTADLLSVEEELSTKALTPQCEEDISSYIDPFDTSIAENILPGKAELKVLESELISEEKTGAEGIKRSYTDPEFDPRDEPIENQGAETTDILGQPQSSVLGIKPLSPVDFEESVTGEDFDPFDTSIATNLIPGKAEIRILESELFGQ